MTEPTTLARTALVLTATGILSVSSVRYARDESAVVALSAGFLLYLAVLLMAIPREPPRWALPLAFVASLGSFLSAGPFPEILAYAAAMVLALALAPAALRPLTLAAYALWTPALRMLGDDPLVALPPVLALAAAVSLAHVTVSLVTARRMSGADALRHIGLGVLSVATVGAVTRRHYVVGSALAPDDVFALLVALSLPLLARGRVRAESRDALAVGLSLATYALVGLALIAGKPYHVDAVAIVHRATEHALAGANPYQAIDALEALERFGLDRSLATDLQDGSQLRNLNYPALSFLVPAPFVALGLADLRPIYLVEIIVLALVLLRRTRVPWRPLVAAALVGNDVITRQFVLAGVDPTWAVLVAVAYLFPRERWISAIALGLAVADRQPAWFFVPFYVATVARRDGIAEALRRSAIALAAFLVPNVPYLLHDPAAWLDGVLTPIVRPLEPYGVGVVRFGMEGLMPLLPRGVYGALSAAMLVGLLVLLWVRWRDLAAGALAFPLVPLALAWRSLQNYFAFAGVFVLIADEKVLTGREDVRSRALEVDRADREGAARDPGLPRRQGAGP